MIFITIVTNQRIPILTEHIGVLRQAFKQVKYKYEVIAAAILPNHLHMTIQPENINEYPKIISSIKYYFSRNIPYKKSNKTKSEILRKEKGIWQRRYYDHIIRNQEDFNKHLDYIHYNPIKHNFTNNAKDWQYSSFEKFVKLGLYDEDWCNFSDKNNCRELDLE